MRFMPPFAALASPVRGLTVAPHFHRLAFLVGFVGSGVVVAGQGPEAHFLRGDSNTDGQVDISDGVRSLIYLFAGAAGLDCPDAADANDSGEVDIADPTFTFNYLFLGGRAPPPPGPESCGADPSADSLACPLFDSCSSIDCRPLTPSIVNFPESTSDDRIRIEGEAEPGSTIDLSGSFGRITTLSEADGSFSVEIDLSPDGLQRANLIYVVARTECALPSSPASVVVIHDSEPPQLFIDYPRAGDIFSEASISVAGRLSDRLSGLQGLSVEVNGSPAEIDANLGTSGTFFIRDVMLLPDGPTTIEVRAIDALGNVATSSVEVHREDPPLGIARLERVSGDGQTARVLTPLVDPIVVRVVRADGRPFARKIVRFRVARSDGKLYELDPDSEGGGGIVHQVRADADGRAALEWVLGSDSGTGNQRVEVSSVDVFGKVTFCASATPGPVKQINVGSGNTQVGETESVAHERLGVRVSDGCNGVAGVRVLFWVSRGDGKVDGEDSIAVETDLRGRAAVEFTFGTLPGAQRVHATILDGESRKAVFEIYAVQRGNNTATSFVGLILDNASQPIEGVTCTVHGGDDRELSAVSDIDGSFRFDNIPFSGPSELFIDGATATRVGGDEGRDLAVGSFPTLFFEPVLVPGAENALPMSIFLPEIVAANRVLYDGTQDVELSAEGIVGFKFYIRAGSMQLADGSVPSPESPVTISLSPVHHDKTPMPIPDGAAPLFAWTLQPSGARFDPPVAVDYPNFSGLAPGASAFFLSFDHDTGKFEIVASGRVSDDAISIRSDPGGGLSVAGWGCLCPPYTVTGSCNHCEGGGGGNFDGAGGAGDEGCEPCEVNIDGPARICAGEEGTYRAIGTPSGGDFAWSGGRAMGPTDLPTYTLEFDRGTPRPVIEIEYQCANGEVARSSFRIQLVDDQPLFRSDETDGEFLPAFEAGGDPIAAEDEFRFLVGSGRQISVRYCLAEEREGFRVRVFDRGGVPVTPDVGFFDADGIFTFTPNATPGNRPRHKYAALPVDYLIEILDPDTQETSTHLITQDLVDTMRQEYIDWTLNRSSFTRGSSGLVDGVPPRDQIEIAASRDLGGRGPAPGCFLGPGPNYYEPATRRGLIWNQGFVALVADIRGRMAPEQVCLHSGHRSPSHNRRANGINNSDHQWGRAADLAWSRNLTIGRVPFLLELYLEARQATPLQVLLEKRSEQLIPSRWMPPPASHVFRNFAQADSWEVEVEDSNDDGLPDRVVRVFPENTIPSEAELSWDGEGTSSPPFKVVDEDGDNVIDVGESLFLEYENSLQTLDDRFAVASHVHVEAP